MQRELQKYIYYIAILATFKFQDYEYKLLDIPRPKDAFLMFQITHCDKNKESGFYVVEIKDKNLIKIGRTQDCDIKLHDISVSRHHATIHIEDIQFYIEDNCSKFGTLILASQKELTLPINSKEKLALQASRTVVVVSVDKKQKNFKKYRVPSQYEVFRELKNQFEDEHNSQIGEKDYDVDEILINDPNFSKDQEMTKMKYANYLSGSLYMPNQSNH